ncbi:MAG: NAD(P)/FAD-dependent oxidoreductase [Myxococcales bacterium]|nr:NAD(P)/FAD-dependent oxidoreductase [Myxococcales bacterium]
MKRSDRELGMDRPISRRDFLNGVGAVAAGTLVPGRALAEAMAALESAGAASAAYPPRLTGMRGSHPGSFEVAHALVREGRSDWGRVEEPDSERYDLIVVGGGISGLAAAHFYRKHKPDARILILDNHDDFGGHAKRNEFQIGGRTIIGYGGSQTLEEPGGYSEAAKGLLRGIGIDLTRLAAGYDQDFYRKNGLRGGTYFDRATYGVDRVIPFELMKLSSYLQLAPSTLTPQAAVAQMPLSKPARQELLKALLIDENRIPDVPAEHQADYLGTISYRDFLSKHMEITEPEVFKLFQDMTADFGVGIDAAPALYAFYYGLPGLDATSLSGLAGRLLYWLYADRDEPYIYHFPDGNASVARLLVREMMPDVAPGSTMEDVVTARFDYSKLDVASSQVRLRLNSTAVRVEHDGKPPSASRVGITYVRDGRAHRVWGRGCVLACYNAMIPHLCPELPASQREALGYAVKSPILYTNVLLRNWQAWKKLGIGGVIAPGSYHITALLDFPIDLGDYKFSRGPDEPIVCHMERFPHRPNEGLTNREQFRAGRQELLSTSFETMERSIRTQLAGMLGEGGFDPARDIEAITVNRWAHGYAYFYNPLFDPEFEEGQEPHVLGRQPLGRITIANSDAAGQAYLHKAIDEAQRAVNELAVGS